MRTGLKQAALEYRNIGREGWNFNTNRNPQKGLNWDFREPAMEWWHRGEDVVERGRIKLVINVYFSPSQNFWICNAT
jgi:hypothetical protein